MALEETLLLLPAALLCVVAALELATFWLPGPSGAVLPVVSKRLLFMTFVGTMLYCVFAGHQLIELYGANSLDERMQALRVGWQTVQLSGGFGAALGLAGLLIAFRALAFRTHKGHDNASADDRTMRIAAGLMLAVFGVGLAAYARQYVFGFHCFSQLSPAEHRDLQLHAAARILDVARLLIVIVLAVTILRLNRPAAGVRLSARVRIQPSRSRGYLLLAVGLLAFVATRGLAYDARHPLSPVMPDHVVAPTFELPESPLCEAGDRRWGPVVQIEIHHTHRGGVMMDGTFSRWSAVPSSITRFRRDWSLLHPSEHYPGRIALSAPPDTPVREIQRLTGILSEHYEPAYAASIVKRFPHQSISLGRLERTRVCSVAFEAESLQAADPKMAWQTFIDGLQPVSSQHLRETSSQRE